MKQSVGQKYAGHHSEKSSGHSKGVLRMTEHYIKKLL